VIVRLGLTLALLASTSVVAERVVQASNGAATPPASLSVWGVGGWRTWWRADRAPARWASEDETMIRSLHWQRGAPGLEWTSVRLAGAGPAWRTRLIVARLDPRQVTISLEMALARDDLRPSWTIDRAPDDALLAVNAGQFVGAMPWGWVVMEGRERLLPGSGPLASAIAIDAAGRVRWAHGGTIAPEGIVTGFQSYPTLLRGDGVVPLPLRAPGSDVNLTHRDARLALGGTRDGKLLVVMTRFDVLGELGGGMPIGPTTPEMAAIMGALGASDAVMLDGGISAQLWIHEPGNGTARRWPGLRKVPLGLIVRPRSLTAAGSR
jgi:hypothetical protein